MSDADDFSDLIDPPEDGESGKQPERMQVWIGTPAVSSLELEILEREMVDPRLAFRNNIPFEEAEDEPQADTPPSDPTELEELQRRVSAHWALRRTVARSLGPDGTWPQYLAACKEEGIDP
jgi:hypothetical protein